MPYEGRLLMVLGNLLDGLSSSYGPPLMRTLGPGLGPMPNDYLGPGALPRKTEYSAVAANDAHASCMLLSRFI